MDGDLSLETCANIFQNTTDPTKVASSNYGIDSNGRVGMYVEEKDRAVTSNSTANDNAAVTIEVANYKPAPTYEVTDKAYNAMIDLCVDVCRRNGMSSLKWTGDASGTLTVHRFFANKACPGQYLFDRMGSIASEVTTRLTECKNLEANVKTAANKLRDQGIINTPDYWVSNFQAIKNLGDLIIKLANAPKSVNITPSVTTVTVAINHLYSRGIINTPSVWIENYPRLLYLNDLLLNTARRIT